MCEIKKINMTIHIHEETKCYTTMDLIEILDWNGSICQIHCVHITITIITGKHEIRTIWNGVESNEKQLKYNDRKKVRFKAYKMSKKHYFSQKSNHFYDFFWQKVIIMIKK